MSGMWGEFLRLRGRLHAAAGRATEAYHDFGQSVSVFDLLGERYQAGLSYLELGGSPATPAPDRARTRYLTDAVGDLRVARRRARPRRSAGRAARRCPSAATGGFVGVQMDGDDALVRRIVDAAVMPALLAREGATALLEACDAHAAVDLHCSCRPASRASLAAAGCDADAARSLARGRAAQADRRRGAPRHVEPLGRDVDGPRYAPCRRAAPLHARRGAALPNAVRGAAPGIRAVLGARAADRSRRPARSSGRSSRCCPGSSAPAPRCSASPTRSSVFRGTT